MERRWKILPYDEHIVSVLHRDLNINKSLCILLQQRGLTGYSDARDFFRPRLSMLHSPWLMKDMDVAVDRINKAVSRDEKILVFGDYDVDGTTAVASVYQFLKTIYKDGQVDFYIPDRYKEGYGVSKQGIDFAKTNGFSLIISLDCGIKSIELIAYAKEKGIDFIVCDHHLPDKTLPPAVAILNPKRKDCAYPYKELCGCGVGLKLIQALCINGNLPDENWMKYLDLAAIAVAADIVPITGENRVIAFYGLKKINEDPCEGVRSILELAGIKNPLTISNVVFTIAPRINAAGRMDDGKKAVKLFAECTPEIAMQFAEMLQTDNSSRKLKDSSITKEALALLSEDPDSINRKSSVVYKEDWHKGVVGIVASRLIEHHYKPTVVLTRNEGIVSGSARSVNGFNLYEAIYACREHLIAYGGHFAAAGLSMLPEKVAAFSSHFESVVASTIADDLLIPVITIDAITSFTEIYKPAFFRILNQMEPFGPGNLRPVFLSKDVAVTSFRLLKDAHLKLNLLQDNISLSGIGFNMKNKFESLDWQKPVDVVYSVDENEYKGSTTIQLQIIDIRNSAKNIMH